jgi:hypothetical protein
MTAGVLPLVLTTLLAGGSQDPADPPTQPPPLEVDVRVGTITPLEAEIGPVSVGARLAAYPWRGNAASRFSVQFVGDYVYVADEEIFDPELRSGTKFTDHFFTLSPAIGVDLVRTSRVNLEVRVGGTVLGERTTFSLEGDIDNDFEQFENVCGLTAFRDRCDSEYDFSTHLAVGFRVLRKPGSPLFFGVDYTWLTLGQHQVVGTIGVAFNR